MSKLFASDFTNEINAVIARFRSDYKGAGFNANPCPYMPRTISGKIINLVGKRRKNSAWLVLFTVELAVELYDMGAKNVTVATSELCVVTKILTERLGYKYMLLREIEDINMNFNTVVGNPPYQGKAELHQKFFNKGVSLLEDGGVIAFIQPATPYFNKKENIRANAKEMIDNVNKYKTNVTIVSSSVFASAQVFNDLAITVLEKTEFNYGKIDSYTSLSGKTVCDVEVDTVNMLEMKNDIYKSLVAKVKAKIAAGDSIYSLISTDGNTDKLHIQKVRGHINHVDFYTIVSANSKYWTVSTEHNYGIAISSTELDSLISYLRSFVARFSLSIYKFNGNNHMGELRSVPVVPFDRIWNDKMLCEYFGISTTEYTEILRCIPDYYKLGTNLS